MHLATRPWLPSPGGCTGWSPGGDDGYADEYYGGGGEGADGGLMLDLDDEMIPAPQNPVAKAIEPAPVPVPSAKLPAGTDSAAEAVKSATKDRTHAR